MIDRILEVLAETTPLAEWLTFSVTVIGIGGVIIEYRRQKRRDQVERAQELVSRLSDDPMLHFATTTLDWGTGIVVVPEAWRDVIGKPFIVWNLEDIRDALGVTLSKTTCDSPVRLLYRHAFVQLFNHMERMGLLLRKGVLHIDDLEQMIWLAEQLKSWKYGCSESDHSLFLDPMTEWYQNGAPTYFIDRVLSSETLKVHES